MIRGKSLDHLVLAVTLSAIAGIAANAQQATLSAAEIVSRNVAARGGLQAWRAIQTLSFSGKMQAGGDNRPSLPNVGSRREQKVATPRPTAQVELPFKMEMKRTRKLRLELQFNGQTAIQVYDGVNGWKMRPFLNRTDYEPYTADETKAASEQADLDGPLVDYAAKGTIVELAGMEKVNGRDNYRLKLTLKSGYSFHVWIDAQTFLESKIEGTPRRLDGEYHPVEIYMTDYRSTNGLMIPYVQETKVVTLAPVAGKKDPPQYSAEMITIEEVQLNRQLEDSLFAEPKSDVAVSGPQAVNTSATAVRR